MSKRIIPQRINKRDLLNELASKINEAYSEDTRRLVYLCYDKGISGEEIARALGTTRQNVMMQYPKGKHGK